MQTDGLENQAPASSTLSGYQRLTMPTREKGNINRRGARGGLLSKPLSASQLLEDQATECPTQPQLLSVTIQMHQNGYSKKAITINSSQLLPNFLPLAPTLENATPRRWEMNATAWGLWDQPTVQLRIATPPARLRSTLSELPHLAGYMIGAAAIFGLYLVIPLIILLNTTLPSNWNKLIIALGILAIGEFLICLILIKTTPRRKTKKGDVFV